LKIYARHGAADEKAVELSAEGSPLREVVKETGNGSALFPAAIPKIRDQHAPALKKYRGNKAIDPRVSSLTGLQPATGGLR
jgi:hypothetical protein